MKMSNLTENKEFEEIKRKIEVLLNQEGFDDVIIDKEFCGGGNNRIDNFYLTIKARNSRGKDKVFNK